MKLSFAIGIVLATLTSVTQANERLYRASLSQSQWSVIGEPTKCELIHEIPGYGRAVISQRAAENLKLRLLSDLELAQESYSHFGSDRPEWKHHGRYIQIGRSSIHAGPEPLSLEREDTLRVMATLDEGNLPGFSYRDPLGGSTQIEVQLNVAHYRAAADEFRRCLGQLVQVDFNAVRISPLFFQFDRDHLTRTTRQRLDKIAEYIKADPTVSRVQVSAHADARGSAEYNRKLSERRAKAVAKYLQTLGIPERLFDLRYFGEAEPKLSNQTSQGRSANRRVDVELIRAPARQQALAR